MKTDRRVPKQETELALRIVLVAPPAGVDFGIQDGKGSDYTTIQTQRSKGVDLSFEFKVRVKYNRESGIPNFLGPLVQGPTTGRFICVDIGRLAGQTDSKWERRIKVPLGGITREMIENASPDPKLIVEARLPGTGKDGGPSCATVHPAQGWKRCRRSK